MDTEQRKCLIVDQIDSPDIAKYLLSTFVKLTIDKPEGPLTDEQELVFLFLFRYGLNAFSLWNIFFPKEIEELCQERKPIPVPDIPASCVIIRSLYENFLVLNYLLDENASTEEREFRQILWTRNGAKTRISFKNEFQTKEELIISIQNDYEKWDIKLKNNTWLKSLSQKDQTAILKSSKVTPLGYSELARCASISINFHKASYRYLSGYAHCDAYSYMNLINGDWQFLMEDMRSNFVFVSALMLNLTKKYLFRQKIESDLDLETIIEFGVGYAQKFDEICEDSNQD